MTQEAGGAESGAAQLAPLHDLLRSGRPLTWLFAGDSITQGVQHTHGQRSWVEHLHERLRFQFGRPSDVVVNTGMSGWTAPMVLGEYDHLIGRFDPHVVSIALGMNDAGIGPGGREVFREAIDELTARSAQRGAFVVLHTPNAIAPGSFLAPDEVGAYAQLVRDVAAARGVLLVDHHAFWKAAFTDQPPYPWLDEPVHPGAAGHRQMADLTLSTLGLGPLEDW